MGWVEFSCDVECPHCEVAFTEHFEFDMDAASNAGVNSASKEIECWEDECGKKFWASAYLSFEVEISNISKKKPKDKK